MAGSISYPRTLGDNHTQRSLQALQSAIRRIHGSIRRRSGARAKSQKAPRQGRSAYSNESTRSVPAGTSQREVPLCSLDSVVSLMDLAMPALWPALLNSELDPADAQLADSIATQLCDLCLPWLLVTCPLLAGTSGGDAESFSSADSEIFSKTDVGSLWRLDPDVPHAVVGRLRRQRRRLRLARRKLARHEQALQIYHDALLAAAFFATPGQCKENTEAKGKAESGEPGREDSEVESKMDSGEGGDHVAKNADAVDRVWAVVRQWWLGECPEPIWPASAEEGRLAAGDHYPAKWWEQDWLDEDLLLSTASLLRKECPVGKGFRSINERRDWLLDWQLHQLFVIEHLTRESLRDPVSAGHCSLWQELAMADDLLTQTELLQAPELVEAVVWARLIAGEPQNPVHSRPELSGLLPGNWRMCESGLGLATLRPLDSSNALARLLYQVPDSELPALRWALMIAHLQDDQTECQRLLQMIQALCRTLANRRRRGQLPLYFANFLAVFLGRYR